jgi:hypothetical protein
MKTFRTEFPRGTRSAAEPSGCEVCKLETELLWEMKTFRTEFPGGS